MPVVRKPLRHPRPRRPAGSGARFGLFGGLPLLALLVAACGAGSTPAPEAGPNGIALVPGAAVSATVGPDGGELRAADADGGRSYRLSVPAAAFGEPTEVTVSPIAAIEGFPLEGDLLGGVELSPEGAVFLVPATLEISLDADRREALRSALGEGQAIVGFDYSGDAARAADDLGITHAEVAEDLSTVRLTLFGFSGHGAGAGNPQNVSCNQPDPARRARCEIQRILHPPGGPADPADPGIRGQIALVFRDWLDDPVLPDLRSAADAAAAMTAIAGAAKWHRVASDLGFLSQIWSAPGDELDAEGRRLDTAVHGALSDWVQVILPHLAAVRADPSTFEAALKDAVDWHLAASVFNYLTGFWYELGDPLQAEALVVRTAVLLAYQEALSAANAACRADGDIASVIRLIELSRIEAALSEVDQSTLSQLLDPANFCVKFRIADVVAPAALDPGESATVGFRIASANPNVTLTAADLSLLLVAGTFTPADSSAISVGQARVPVNTGSHRVEVTVTALRAIPGSTTEGSIRLGVTVAGLDPNHASETVMIDIRRRVTTCTGSPATIHSINGTPSNISIVVDPDGTCRIVSDFSENDDPNVALRVGSDPGEPGWDADSGANWARSISGNDIPPGPYSVNVTDKSSGRTYTLTLVVELQLLNAKDLTMTVRDAEIVAVGAP